MFWPCETRTSTCRSFATISSGLYRFLAIAVLLDVKDIPQVGPLQWGWITLSLIRCGGPSATRTRTAAKRALSFPVVPVRQPMFCHLAASASMSSAASEDVPLAGTAASGNRPDHLHVDRVYLEVPRDPHCPGKFASCEPLAERRAQPITSIR